MTLQPGIGRQRAAWRVLLPAVLLLAAACAPQDTGEPAAEAPETAAEPVPDEQAAATLPEASADAVLAYLEAADFRSNWDLWPGKDEKYPGTEPHGALLTTYTNPSAAEAASDRASGMPGDVAVSHGSVMSLSEHA